jgi:hypothetical protein
VRHDLVFLSSNRFECWILGGKSLPFAAYYSRHFACGASIQRIGPSGCFGFLAGLSGISLTLHQTRAGICGASPGRHPVPGKKSWFSVSKEFPVA